MIAMDKRELLDRYEATGDESAFTAARSLYEQALEQNPADATLRRDYGYLLECHGRYWLRRAVGEYVRAIEVDPDLDKTHYQMISARAAAYGGYESTVAYRERLAASPGDVREYRFLASAYLADHDYRNTDQVIDAGLRLAPDDPLLLDFRGEVRAHHDEPDGALADWQHAVELDPNNIGPLYSSAFLLERRQRIPEAIAAWRAILDWSQARGYTLDAEWPTREIQRLKRSQASSR